MTSHYIIEKDLEPYRQDGASNQLIGVWFLNIKRTAVSIRWILLLWFFDFFGIRWSCKIPSQSVSATKGLSVFETVFTSWFSSMHQYHWELLYCNSSNRMHVCHYSPTNGTQISYAEQWILSFATVQVLKCCWWLCWFFLWNHVFSISHEELLFSNHPPNT